MNEVFLSYRRDATKVYAGRIHDRLVRALGRSRVLFDTASIEAGEAFPEWIARSIPSSAVLLVLIDRTWLDVMGRDGKRRLDDPGDFIRQEVRIALEAGVLTIPVLLDSADLPQANELPADIADLTKRQAVKIRSESFLNDTGSLINRVSKHVNREELRCYGRYWTAIALFAVAVGLVSGLPFRRLVASPPRVMREKPLSPREVFEGFNVELTGETALGQTIPVSPFALTAIGPDARILITFRSDEPELAPVLSKEICRLQDITERLEAIGRDYHATATVALDRLRSENALGPSVRVRVAAIGQEMGRMLEELSTRVDGRQIAPKDEISSRIEGRPERSFSVLGHLVREGLSFQHAELAATALAAPLHELTISAILLPRTQGEPQLLHIEGYDELDQGELLARARPLLSDRDFRSRIAQEAEALEILRTKLARLSLVVEEAQSELETQRSQIPRQDAETFDVLVAAAATTEPAFEWLDSGFYLQDLTLRDTVLDLRRHTVSGGDRVVIRFQIRRYGDDDSTVLTRDYEFEIESSPWSDPARWVQALLLLGIGAGAFLLIQWIALPARNALVDPWGLSRARWLGALLAGVGALASLTVPHAFVWGLGAYGVAGWILLSAAMAIAFRNGDRILLEYSARKLRQVSARQSGG